MKKRIFVIFAIIGMLLVVFICLKNISFGISTKKMINSDVTLKIPKMSLLDEECCMFSATFKSLSSKKVLQKELNNIINGYDKKTCNNRTIYYDKEQKISIYDYGIKSGFILNEYYINYDKVEYDANSCSVVTDPTKLTYSVKKSSRDDNDCNGPITYKNEDGKTYNLYYNWCFGDLLFQTGTGTMNYLYAMLGYGWISMQDVTEFLEYQVKNNEATKEVFKDEGSIIYRNKNFSLLRCNTKDGNKNIYIDERTFEYKENYCK